MQRVSTGSIFNTIPILVGDKIDQRKVIDISKALFATEQFDDIQVGRDGRIIITVTERPSIASINISGNQALKTEQLLESFTNIGITEGYQVYKRSTLEKMSRTYPILFITGKIWSLS